MNDKEFIESVFEIAFGDNAINRGFSREEVIKEIRRFSDLALEYENNCDDDYESSLNQRDDLDWVIQILVSIAVNRLMKYITLGLFV